MMSSEPPRVKETSVIRLRIKQMPRPLAWVVASKFSGSANAASNPGPGSRTEIVMSDRLTSTAQ